MSDSIQRAERVSAPVLVYYNASLPIQLACDASPYGVGAVLAHKMLDGTAQPIAYASRTFSTAEKNYVQLVHESLVLIYGVKRFHNYLYGRPFRLVTDHKPLTTILGLKAGIPSLAAA